MIRNHGKDQEAEMMEKADLEREAAGESAMTRAMIDTAQAEDAGGKVSGFSEEVKFSLSYAADFDEMPCGILVYRKDEPYEILYANRRAAKVWGCDSVDEFMEFVHGRAYRLIYEEDRIPAWSAIVSRQEKGNHEFHDVEFRITRKDGHIQWINSNGRLMASNVGPLVYGMVYEIKGKEKKTGTMTGFLDLPEFMEQVSALMNDNRQRKVYEKRCLLFLDVEKFRLYNERFGLKAGDDLIYRINKELTRAFPQAIVTRRPVDCFCVFTPAEGLVEQLEKFRKSLSDVKGYDGLVINAGIYEIPKEEIRVGVCISNAEEACRSIAGMPGKDTAWYDNDLIRSLAIENYVASHIDEAIEKKWIKVYYQPVIRTVNEELCSAEALARWVDPVYGLLGPGQFISALEKTRQIHKLDKYILRAVCEEYRERKAKGLPVVPVSFNLSRYDFLEEDIAGYVLDAVEACGMPRDMIMVEITESMAAEEPEIIRRDIARLQAAGIQVWMDDFGSGYSSLNLLKDFNFNEIKLDMAFFSNFTDKAKIIIADLIRMVKSLGIQTLAEGVETKEEYDFLRSVGCEKVQGWYFGKPEPYEDLMKHMGEKKISPEIYQYHTLFSRAGAVDFQIGKALAIVRKRGDQYAFSYAGEDYKKLLGELGISVQQGIWCTMDNFCNFPQAHPLCTIIDQALETGSPAHTYMIWDQGYMRFEASLIAREGEESIYLCTLEKTDAGAGGSRTQELDALVRNLYQAYDFVGLVDLKEDRTRILFNRSPFRARGEGIASVKEWLESDMGNVIAPEDHERYLQFTDYSNLERHHGRAFSALFRTRNRKGGYTWKLHVIIPVLGGKTGELLYLTHYSPAGEAEMIRILYESAQNGQKQD